MRWEELTSKEFPGAVEKCGGVAVMPIGVIEPHASHLPLGTDMLEVHRSVCEAAATETALVFPQYPFGINHESAHLPGSVVLSRKLVFALLEEICEEMGRHGIRKILLVSGHGGNRFFLPLFVQTLTERRRDYVAYFHHVTPGLREVMEEVLETEETGHACEYETSVALHIHPRLVKMEQLPPRAFPSLRGNEQLQKAGVYSALDWYAMYPAMYVGDASKADAEKGRRIHEKRVAGIVEAIRAVKTDTVTPRLLGEFQAGAASPRPHPRWTEDDGRR